MDYLYFLQQLRDAAPTWLNEAILFVSEFSGGVGGLAVMALVFWCISKAAGIFLMMNFSLAYVCNGIIKNILQVPRPFLRDPRLTPYTPATGYSFPSGHTMLATGFYGGLALWQRKRKWLAAIFVALALFTGLSRNWLGAHTIQDVAAGILCSCGVIALNCLLLRAMDRDGSKDWAVLAGAAVLCLLYCLFLPSGVKPVGMYAGTMLGWFLDRRFIRYQARGTLVFRAVSFLLGMAVLALVHKVLLPPVLEPLGAWGDMLNYFLTFLLISAGWPWVIRMAQSKLAAPAA